ncbi:PAS domain-containing sensor histidine kinase [Ferruginibacter profundus]
MNKRLRKISAILSDYSRGNFHKQIPLSPVLDQLDGISSNINMLGEELHAATISRNYFNNIYNAVTDMVLVVNTRGFIEEVNEAATKLAAYKPLFLKGKSLATINIKGLPHFRKLLQQLKISHTLQYECCRLKTARGQIIPVRVSLVYFADEQLRYRVLLTVKDISYRIKTENLVIRAIIDTQEKERTRLAKDLHDSLIQQMAGIKFYISTIAGCTKNLQQKEILLQANTAMAEMIVDTKNICFNLMPRSLEQFGLVKAVQVFCNQVLVANKIKFDITDLTGWPVVLPSLAIDLYRVVQEFIHNAVKHGKARRIKIQFSHNKNALTLVLQDNGKGFNTRNVYEGMGLKNVQSRVRSHDGKLKLTSITGKGTRYVITIPLN